MLILASISIVIMNPADIMFAVAIVALLAITFARFAGTRILKTLHAVIAYKQRKANDGPDYIETDDDGFPAFQTIF